MTTKKNDSGFTDAERAAELKASPAAGSPSKRKLPRTGLALRLSLIPPTTVAMLTSANSQ